MDEKPHFLTEARYGALRDHDRFRAGIAELVRGDRCVLRTTRGVEIGTITSMPEPCDREDARVPCEVLRKAEPEDLARLAELRALALDEDADFCQERIEAHALPMRLVNVERLFGGGRIIFYFVADGRVDFRELVKDLARHFRTRIELRQIGVRDEAKMLGDHEYCGRDLCCLDWMREILPVTMRMAKNQKSTLDPNKISGRCGRLKCCLRFEDEVYSDLRSSIPRPGAQVVTERGPGRVLAVDTLSRSVTVELAGGGRVNVPCVELCAAPPKSEKTAQDS